MGVCVLSSENLAEPGRLEDMVPGRADAALPAQVVYSEFLDLVNTGNVRQARIDESLQKVYFSVRPLQQAGQQDAPAEASTSGSYFWPYQMLCTNPDIGVQGFSVCSKGLTLHTMRIVQSYACAVSGIRLPQKTYFIPCIEWPDALQACQQRGQLCCSECRRTHPRTL